MTSINGQAKACPTECVGLLNYWRLANDFDKWAS